MTLVTNLVATFILLSQLHVRSQAFSLTGGITTNKNARCAFLLPCANHHKWCVTTTTGSIQQHRRQSYVALGMTIDDAMRKRLDGIARSYQALTERLGDPDVIADSNLLMKVMSDRAKSEDVVNAYDEVRR
jgi:Protein chain release factor A